MDKVNNAGYHLYDTMKFLYDCVKKRQFPKDIPLMLAKVAYRAFGVGG